MPGPDLVLILNIHFKWECIVHKTIIIQSSNIPVEARMQVYILLRLNNMKLSGNEEQAVYW